MSCWRQSSRPWHGGGEPRSHKEFDRHTPSSSARIGGAVDTFITSYVIYAGLALALGSPVSYVAWRKGRLTAMRNFFVGALVIALLCAVLSVVSVRQVSECMDAGHSDCFDSGAVGLQLLFVGLYAVAAWINAYFIWSD